MPIVKCPGCQAERVIPDGKKKNCRKCGLQLTSNGLLSQPGGGGVKLVLETRVYETMTVADLEANRPDLVAEIRGEEVIVEPDSVGPVDPESGEVELPETVATLDYDSMNMVELSALAEERGILFKPNTRKKVLIRLLKENDGK